MNDDKPLPARTDGLAIGTFTLGALSFCLPVVCAIPALILGVISLSAIRNSNGMARGKGWALAGMGLSLTSSFLLVCAGAGFLGFRWLGNPFTPAESPDWIVLLRSADPSIWGQDVNQGPERFATSQAAVPFDIRYLRIRKGTGKDADHVIIEMTLDRLRKVSQDGRYGWEGTGHSSSGARHLGIYALDMPVEKDGDICIRVLPWHRGWGFGHKHWIPNVQGYCWDGQTIPPTVFEIAVKRGELTETEKKKLLRSANPRIDID